ncbi:MAG TPA: peptidylprolyl isomerase [Spirochaetota bacterium]|nr:peptidylprolyl isomerase [Spirochaetota bacterium]
MKKTVHIIVVAIALIGLMGAPLKAWEVYDRVLAVVNDQPIVESQLMKRFNHYRELKRIPQSKVAYEKSRLLDSFIEDALFQQTAEEEAIIVSDKKVDHFIEKVMKRLNMNNIDEFKKKIEEDDNMSFDEYRDNIKRSMTRELVMSITVGVSPPTNKAAKAWYRRNAHKVGYEVYIKHIFMRPRNRSMAEEKRVNSEMRAIRNRLFRGSSFESLAAQYSEDTATKGRGGSFGWVKLADIDRYLAMQVFNMRVGQISPVIKSGEGYHIVKFFGKRPVTYESIRGLIFNILYNKRLAKQVGRWAEQKKKVSDIKIFMKDYTKR